MKNVIKCICFVLFFLCFSGLTCFADTKIVDEYEITGGSTTCNWEDAQVVLEFEMSKTFDGAKYKKEDASKDLNYIAFVCLSHEQPYEVYKVYEDMFINWIEDTGYKLNRYDSALYTERFAAVNTLMETVHNREEELVAFSGFNYKLDSLPFNNLSFADARKEGVCVGMVYYELFNYLCQGTLYDLNFKFLRNDIKKSDTTYGPLLSANAKIEAEGDEVFEDRLYNYEPVDIKLRTNVVADSMESWEEKEKTTKDLVELYGLERGTCDDNVVRSIYWLWGWGNLICNKQIDSMLKNQEFAWEVPVITGNMMEVISEELKASRPLPIIIGRANGARHAVLGYKLTRDKENADIYYLHVIDSNFPGNYVKDKQYEFKIALCKGTYNGNEAYYYMYAPYSSYKDTNSTQYTQGLIISNYEGLVLNRSIKDRTWGRELSSITQTASKNMRLNIGLNKLDELKGEYLAPNYFNIELDIRDGNYLKSIT